MNVVLIMVRENGERRSFAVTRDTTVIGRSESADFRIPLTDVSRKHCRLIKDGNALLLEDLGSSNGTMHNGEKVKEMELSAGDSVQIGPIKFIIQIDGEPAEEDAGEARRMRSASPSAAVSNGKTLSPPPEPPPSFDSSTFAVTAAEDSGLELEPPGR